VGVNIGVEYRRDYLQEDFDTEQQQGDLSGGGGQLLNTSGATNTKDVFFELRAPIAHDLPFVKDLTLDGGYRYSHYSEAGDDSTYKVGIEYKPIDDLLIRASYNHAVRAPNVQDLYAPDVVGDASYQDPCGQPDPTPTNPNPHPQATLAQCENTGLKASQYGVTAACPAAQCDTLTGGGAATGLKPEEADTYTLGFVFTPTFFPGFSFSMDYFDIKVNNVISNGVGTPSTILTACLASASSPLCALIHRDPVDGSLFTAQGYVNEGSVNAGFVATDGIDFTANYRMTLPNWIHGASAGSAALSFTGTWTDHLTAEPIPGYSQNGISTYDCAGLYGNECSGQFGSPVTPHFKSTTRITWNTPWKLSASLQWRYIGPVGLDLLSSNPFLFYPGINPPTVTGSVIDGSLHAYNYFDLVFTYKVKDGVTLRVGCNNPFDIDPPAVDSVNLGVSGPPYGNGNTFPGVYDSLGRQIFMGLTANF
jgi:outer membrane receptor protein involved in Fe transport